MTTTAAAARRRRRQRATAKPAARPAVRSDGYTSFPDYLDPALCYTQEGWQSLWTVYTPLLTYKHAEGAEGAEVIPGLAEAMPEITDDGKIYKLKLREGLKYSDGTPVKASDFEHTVQRVLNLESGGSSFYLGIVGAEDYVKAGKAKDDIEGIVTDDADRDITITLNEPDGALPVHPRDGLRRRSSRATRPSRTRRRTRRPASARTSSRTSGEPRLRPRQGRELPTIDGHPGGQARHDPGRGRQEPPPPDAGHDQQQDRLHERPARGRPDARGQASSTRTSATRSSSRTRPTTSS